jgi:hypothetical protein
MPRRDLTLTDKIALFEKIKNQPLNTHHQLAERTGVPKSTIAHVIQQDEKLRDELTLCHGQQGNSQKGKHEGKVPDVEETHSQRFSIITGLDVCVSGPVLKRKSEELAKMLGLNSLKRSAALE